MNCVIQYYVRHNGVGKDILNEHYPESVPDWVKCSKESFSKYASIHNSDHFFYEDKFVNSKSNFFEALRVYLDPSLDKYDKVLYCDCDVLVKSFSENIFDIPVLDIAGVPESKISDYKVPVNWNKGGPLQKRYEHFGSTLVKPKTVNAPIRMINSGVVLWTREARLKARNMFDSHKLWFEFKNPLLDSSVKGWGHSSHCLDQPYLNCMWTKFDFDVLELSYKWNRFPTKDEKHACVFAHYVQNERYNIPNIWKSL